VTASVVSGSFHKRPRHLASISVVFLVARGPNLETPVSNNRLIRDSAIIAASDSDRQCY